MGKTPLFFTVFLLVILVIHQFMGLPTIETSQLWQLGLLSLIGAVLQTAAFNPIVFPHLRSRTRNLIFVPSFLLVMAGFACWGNWFPTEYFSAWLIFIGIFIVLYLIVPLVFGLYYRVTGQHYDLALSQYKKENQ